MYQTLVILIVIIVIGILFYKSFSKNDSADAVTFFTYIHALVGFLVGWFRIISFELLAILAIGFEIWENSSSGVKFFEGKDRWLFSIRDKLGIDFTWGSYAGDSVANSQTDVLST